jgi:hypothetical protein
MVSTVFKDRSIRFGAGARGWLKGWTANFTMIISARDNPVSPHRPSSPDIPAFGASGIVEF